MPALCGQGGVRWDRVSGAICWRRLDLHYGGWGMTRAQTGLLVGFALVRGLLLSAKYLSMAAGLL